MYLQRMSNESLGCVARQEDHISDVSGSCSCKMGEGGGKHNYVTHS